MTAAWLADRDDRSLTAGLWLGAAVYLKPFLALVVVYWLWRRAWLAAGTAAAVTAVGYAMGLIWLPVETVAWLEALRSVTWQYTSINLTVWGWIARSDLPPWVAVALTAIVLGLLRWRLPVLTRDGAWFGVLVAACLVSPVAWIYYVLPLIGPLGIVYQQGDGLARRFLQLGYIGLCVPFAFQAPALEAGRLSAATAGSWYLWAFVCWWLASLRPVQKRHSAGAERVVVKRRDSIYLL